MVAAGRSVSEVEGFINMLHAACEDQYMNETLQRLLSQPDEARQQIVLKLVKNLEAKSAPPQLIEAISCLVDDAIAEKAYEVIFQCTR